MAQFTKKALIESFIKLLNQTSLDKITVKEIVDDCGVNRNTFYYYFKDIYDLLDEIFTEETKRVVDGGKIYSSWQDAFLESARFALENKRAIYHVYNSLSREQVERYLYGVTDSLVLGFVQKQAEGLNVPEEDRKFIADFYKYALVGFLLEWVRGGMKEDPEYFVNKMGKLFDGNIKFSLENSVG